MNFSVPSLPSLPHLDNGDNNESIFLCSAGAWKLSVHLRLENQYKVSTHRVTLCLLLFSQHKLVLDIFTYDAIQTSTSPCFRVV